MKHALLVGAALLFGGSVGHAQASADSAKAQPKDSLAKGKPDSVVGGTRDSSAAQPGAQQPTQPSAAPVRAAAPVDSILAAACHEAPSGRPAPGLLTVVFRAGTPDTARMAAAREISGTLAVTASGEEYVRLSPESGPLAVAAARLIRLPPVTSVSEKSCP